MTIADGSEHEHHAGRNDARRSMFDVRCRGSTDDGKMAMLVVLSRRLVGRDRRCVAGGAEGDGRWTSPGGLPHVSDSAAEFVNLW